MPPRGTQTHGTWAVKGSERRTRLLSRSLSRLVGVTPRHRRAQLEPTRVCGYVRDRTARSVLARPDRRPEAHGGVSSRVAPADVTPLRCPCARLTVIAARRAHRTGCAPHPDTLPAPCYPRRGPPCGRCVRPGVHRKVRAWASFPPLATPTPVLAHGRRTRTPGYTYASTPGLASRHCAAWGGLHPVASLPPVASAPRGTFQRGGPRTLAGWPPHPLLWQPCAVGSAHPLAVWRDAN